MFAVPGDIPSGCCFFTGPWSVTRSSLRTLRRVVAFCQPLRPVLLLLSFPRSRSPVVGVPGLFWLRRVPFVEVPPPRLQGAQPMPSNCVQVPASMAFVADSKRPQPLWQPPSTAWLTASLAASEVTSLRMQPWEGTPPPSPSQPLVSAHNALQPFPNPQNGQNAPPPPQPPSNRQ